MIHFLPFSRDNLLLHPTRSVKLIALEASCQGMVKVKGDGL
jgi:hypothetical protein